MNNFHYVGSELDLFAAAVRWKEYWSAQVRPFLSGDVLEVGAGTGINTPFLMSDDVRRWICLEPDPELAAQIPTRLAAAGLEKRCVPMCGDISSIDAREKFDTIIYIDVLEHIEDDRAEMLRAASKLRPGGRIVVLAPAHQRLYSPFDASIGHYRRYDRRSLTAVFQSVLIERIFYLDSVGLLASSANRFFLRQTSPTSEQIQVWDRWMIPASKVVDKVFGYSVGKSIVGVWRLP